MVQLDIYGHTLRFETHPALFSPTAPDRGTMAMLSVAKIAPGDRVLDMGCGWGLVAVAAAKIAGAQNVVALDVDARAVEVTRENARRNGVGELRALQRDGFCGFDGHEFHWILCNPPYNSNFSVAKHFIEKGFNRLAMNGTMLMVVKRRDWYRNRLCAVFGGVTAHQIDGYFVFEAQRRSARYAGRVGRRSEPN